MVIELFGIPGSGKSSICMLAEKKYNLDNPMFYYMNNYIGKIQRHFLWKSYSVNFFCNRKYNAICSLIDNNYINKFNPEISIKQYIRYMLFVKYVEKQCKNISIIDEGIIHYCMSLYAEFDVPFEIIECIICLIYDEETETIGVECEPNEAYSRIKKRNRHKSMIDELGETEMIEMLNKYDEAFKHFSLRYESVKIDDIDFVIRKKLEVTNSYEI